MGLMKDASQEHTESLQLRTFVLSVCDNRLEREREGGRERVREEGAVEGT